MFTPENELGVIVRFAQEAHHHGFLIQSINANFPDAMIEKDGNPYRAEFEFLASAFDLHDHDHRECDLIICWQNDCPNHALPILALSEDGWMNTDLSLPTDSQRAAQYWQRRALKAERTLRALKNKEGKVAELTKIELLECDKCDKIFGWPEPYKDHRAAQNALNAHRRKHERQLERQHILH